ncbi:MAG: prepilin-type N-terminal cleavage/methylation domain-containing protein [Phycisphaerae bacterium]
MNTLDMKKRAVSLVELIVVVVVLGLLAAVAIPHFSQGATDDCGSRLKTDLAVLRTAIELYYQDHDAYPGQRAAGTVAAGAGTAAAFIRQLTQFSDAEGRVSPTPSEVFCYGPYLQRGVPRCPVSPAGPSARIHLLSGPAVPAYIKTALNAGWVYNYETGYIAANSNAADARGVHYDSY